MHLPYRDGGSGGRDGAEDGESERELWREAVFGSGEYGEEGGVADEGVML